MAVAPGTEIAVPSPGTLPAPGPGPATPPEPPGPIGMPVPGRVVDVVDVVDVEVDDVEVDDSGVVLSTGSVVGGVWGVG